MQMHFRGWKAGRYIEYQEYTDASCMDDDQIRDIIRKTAQLGLKHWGFSQVDFLFCSIEQVHQRQFEPFIIQKEA